MFNYGWKNVGGEGALNIVNLLMQGKLFAKNIFLSPLFDAKLFACAHETTWPNEKHYPFIESSIYYINRLSVCPHFLLLPHAFRHISIKLPRSRNRQCANLLKRPMPLFSKMPGHSKDLPETIICVAADIPNMLSFLEC